MFLILKSVIRNFFNKNALQLYSTKLSKTASQAQPKFCFNFVKAAFIKKKKTV